MAVPSRQDAEAKPSPQRRKAKVRLARSEDQAAPSPVLEQQARLHDQWIADHRGALPGKWSKRRTVAFVILSCGGFWACVALGVAWLVR